MARPSKRSWSIQLYSFSAESDLSALEHDPQNHVTERGRESSAHQSGQTRIRAHQLGDDKARGNSRDCSANRDLIRNNKVFEIDKGGDEQDRNKNPIGDGDFPRKRFPNGEKQKRGEQFDTEIAKGNSGPALGATAAQKQPANQRNILMPGNRRFAGWTERTPRPVHA